MSGPENVVMTDRVVFCDIDGTISDDRPRAHLLAEAHKMAEVRNTQSPSHFDRYHSRLSNDDIFPDVVEALLLCHKQGKSIVFVTGRTEKWRKETANWLAAKCPQLCEIYSHLYMRDDYAVVSNEKNKASHIRNYHGIIDTIIDDSETVLDYLRKEYPTAHLVLAKDGTLLPCPSTRPIPMQSTAEPTVDEALKILADLFLDRNKLYGDNYKKFGALMLALQAFVPGGSFPTETKDDWNRLGLLVMLASKLSRYCSKYMDGGHPDSLDDNSVYSQMLNEIDRGIQSTKQE